ncbi:MAG: class I SAM-dependent methyltransferase [Phycisphaerales bacterium]
MAAGISLLATACWMYMGSRYGKVAERDRLLDRLHWRGDERVLDIGCGRGLMLVGAARRLTTGSAVGIDIWQATDLSGNSADAALGNARAEGVAERVSVETADMRRLPFPDASFDVVVSRAAIHNLYSAPDRAAAVREIARVLKPGGRALIADIRHHGEHARTFRASGCDDIQRLDSKLMAALCSVITLGSLRPGTLLVSKAA